MGHGITIPVDLIDVFIYRKPAAWDPEILRAVKPRDQSAVLYAARPPTLRANQVPYELKESRTNKKASIAASSASHNGTCQFLYLVLCGMVM